MKRKIVTLGLIAFVITFAANELNAQNESGLTHIYKDFNHGQNTNSNTEWIQSIRIVEPACRSEVEGKVTVKFTAAGMEQAKAFCWRQPTAENTSEWGHDAVLTPAVLKLGKKGLMRNSPWTNHLHD